MPHLADVPCFLINYAALICKDNKIHFFDVQLYGLPLKGTQSKSGARSMRCCPDDCVLIIACVSVEKTEADLWQIASITVSTSGHVC